MDNGTTGIIPIREIADAIRSQPALLGPASQPALPVTFPELPELPVTTSPIPSFRTARAGGSFRPIPHLRSGCYAVRFVPDPRHPSPIEWPAAVGTLRLESLGPGRWVASGDLYRTDSVAPASSVLRMNTRSFASSNRTIPVFPRSQYHAYLRLGAPTAPGIHPGSRSPIVPGLHFEGSVHRLLHVDSPVWSPGENVILRFQGSPGIRPGNIDDRGVFEVCRGDGSQVHGMLHIDWVSEYFREATVEIDTEEGVPAPVSNGNGEDWSTVFGRIGWRIHVETGRLEAMPPTAGAWSMASLHHVMLQSRGGADLDVEWRYHVTAVHFFAGNGTPLGIAFDHESGDLNGIPREGVALAAGARLPSLPIYGPYAGKRMADCPDLYFQVALHEVGHAMGLYHNRIGHGVMEQIDDRAVSTGTHLTRESLLPRFDPDDIYRLRHLPDIYVRPGGTDWETSDLTDDRNEAHGFAVHPGSSPARHDSDRSWELRLSTVNPSLPLGAPVRVDLELRNVGARPRWAPGRLSLATPFVKGWVVGPDGSEHAFRSLFKSFWIDSGSEVAAGETRQGSITLLRGWRGALFHRPGQHEVWLEVEWSEAGEIHCARQRMKIDVQPSATREEARAARRLLTTPATLGCLVIGASPAFKAGEIALDAALQVDRLRPHVAYIRARSLADSLPRQSEVRNVIVDLLTPVEHHEVLNRSERHKAASLRAACVPTHR
jgi:hypothetical protein